MGQAVKNIYDVSATDQPILCDALIGRLEDCKTMLGLLSDEQYCQTTPYKSNPEKSHSSIGQHTRHIVEFVETLLRQNSAGLVDYDARQRDKEIETDRGYASEVIEKFQKILGGLTAQELLTVIKIHEAVHVDHDIEPQMSTLGREIIFVLSHTDHHFALISGQCDAMGVCLPDNFGKAISTLRHELSLKL